MFEVKGANLLWLFRVNKIPKDAYIDDNPSSYCVFITKHFCPWDWSFWTWQRFSQVTIYLKLFQNSSFNPSLDPLHDKPPRNQKTFYEQYMHSATMASSLSCYFPLLNAAERKALKHHTCMSHTNTANMCWNQLWQLCTWKCVDNWSPSTAT